MSYYLYLYVLLADFVHETYYPGANPGREHDQLGVQRCTKTGPGRRKCCHDDFCTSGDCGLVLRFVASHWLAGSDWRWVYDAGLSVQLPGIKDRYQTPT